VALIAITPKWQLDDAVGGAIDDMLFTKDKEVTNAWQSKSCEFDEKISPILHICVHKTCKEDGYDCPVCKDDESLNYDYYGLGECVKNESSTSSVQSSFSESSLQSTSSVQSSISESSSQSVQEAKNCRDDGYNCPYCNPSTQTLQYYTDGSGYCAAIAYSSSSVSSSSSSSSSSSQSYFIDDFAPTLMYWDDANIYCQSKGMHIATMQECVDAHMQGVVFSKSEYWTQESWYQEAPYSGYVSFVFKPGASSYTEMFITRHYHNRHKVGVYCVK